MPKYNFQIETPETSSPSYPMCRDPTRQLTWSATPGPSCRRPTQSPTPSILSPPSNIPIDPALTSYRSQSIVLPSIESSAAPPPPKTKGSTRTKGTRLTAAEDTSLIHICLQNQSAYGLTPGDTLFWKKVRLLFAKETKRDYTKPKRHVSDLMERRKIHLSMLGTGDEDQETTYTKAIDDWIKVVDTHTGEKTSKKQTAKEEARKIRTAEKTRDNLMRRMGNKRLYASSFSSSSSVVSSEEPEEIRMDSPSLNPPSISSHSASITPAPSIASNSDRHRPKRTRRIREPKTTADNDSTGVVGLRTALTKFVEVLTARSQQQSGSERIGEVEPTGRVERTEEAREEDSEVLGRLDRLEKGMSAILQALERREKDRE